MSVVALRPGFDARRNTSRVQPVPLEAVEACRRTMQRAARERPDWFVWLEARRAGRHEHALTQLDGRPAACPVRGCNAVTAL